MNVIYLHHCIVWLRNTLLMLIKCSLIINFNRPSVAGNIWGLFFLMTVSHPADVDTSCSCCVWSFFSLLIIDLKREPERNDDKRGVERERERSPRCRLPLCSAPPGSQCPEGGSRRTNPTHHLSPEQPGGHFIYATEPPCLHNTLQHTHSFYHACEVSALTT